MAWCVSYDYDNFGGILSVRQGQRCMKTRRHGFWAVAATL